MKLQQITRTATTIAIAILVSAVGVQAAQAASFVPLGDLSGGEFRSEAWGVSADGSVVVGFSEGVNGEEAFRWENGVMTGLGDLPGGAFFSNANAVSADGSVVVGASISANGIVEAFRWENGVMTGLGDLPGGNFFSSAVGVSADGSVVVGGGAINSGFESFRWENGVLTGLGNLLGEIGSIDENNPLSNRAEGVSADGSVVVGRSTGNNGGEAFRWENGVMTGLGALPGVDFNFNSVANATSADGSVVVGRSNNANTDGSEAFRWENGVMTGLGGLPGRTFSSNAFGVSADGSVIVGNSSSTNGSEAFIWTSNSGMLPLQDVLTDAGVDLTGWQLYDARRVSADGRAIVGVGKNPRGNTEAWLARLDAPSPPPNPVSVPEPGTTIALLTGLAGMGIAKYQMRKHNVA